jgi:protoporphyrinogen oxidase
MTSKNSVAAQNRFLYYPDHLVRMPGPGSSSLQNFISLATEPVFKGIISGMFGELFKPKRPDDLEDESVGSFLSRRFGPPIADNLASAILHGIYAGDVYQLSVRSIMPYLWKTESRYQSIIKGAWNRALGGPAPMADQDIKLIQDLANRPLATAKLEAIKKSSVFTFKHGIGELAETLEAKLQESPNVDIQRQTAIEKLDLDTEGPSTMVYNHTTHFSAIESFIS